MKTLTNPLIIAALMFAAHGYAHAPNAPKLPKGCEAITIPFDSEILTASGESILAVSPESLQDSFLFTLPNGAQIYGGYAIYFGQFLTLQIEGNGEVVLGKPYTGTLQEQPGFASIGARTATNEGPFLQEDFGRSTVNRASVTFFQDGAADGTSVAPNATTAIVCKLRTPLQ